MAVQNSIAAQSEAKKPMNQMKCVYKAGDQEVTLTPQFVKQYLVTGDADKVSTQEVVMFINLCKYQQLNPFLREAYLIKYGSSPANLVVGKAAFEARADRNEKYQGYEAGIVVSRPDGTLEYRKGTIVAPGETLVGGWAEVYVEGKVKPIYCTASLKEYSTGKSVWATKPATMIRKVAKMQALREAFPNALGSMYTADELGGSDEELPTQPIDQPEQAVEPVVVKEPDPVPEPAQEAVVVDVEPEILDGSDFL